MSSRNECLQFFPNTHEEIQQIDFTKLHKGSLARRLEFNLKLHSISRYFLIVSKRNWKKEEGWRVQTERNLQRFGGKYSSIFYIKCHGK